MHFYLFKTIICSSVRMKKLHKMFKSHQRVWFTFWTVHVCVQRRHRNIIKTLKWFVYYVYYSEHFGRQYQLYIARSHPKCRCMVGNIHWQYPLPLVRSVIQTISNLSSYQKRHRIFHYAYLALFPHAGLHYLKHVIKRKERLYHNDVQNKFINKLNNTAWGT